MHKWQFLFTPFSGNIGCQSSSFFKKKRYFFKQRNCGMAPKSMVWYHLQKNYRRQHRTGKDVVRLLPILLPKAIFNECAFTWNIRMTHVEHFYVSTCAAYINFAALNYSGTIYLYHQSLFYRWYGLRWSYSEIFSSQIT